MVDAISREGELEEVTDALLLTASDDFNALAAAELRNELGHGHVYRIAPHPSMSALLPPSKETGILGAPSLTFAELNRQFSAGARIVNRSADQTPRAQGEPAPVPLFAVKDTGKLRVATDGRPLDVLPGDTVIGLTTNGSTP